MFITDFVKSALPILQRNSVLEDIDITLAEIDKTVQPSYGFASQHFDVNRLSSTESKDLEDSFYRNFKFSGNAKKYPKVGNFISEINRALVNVRQNLEYVRELVDTVLERDVVREGLTTKKAILLRAAESMSFISNYSLDLLNLVYCHEARQAGISESDIIVPPPAKLKEINTHIQMFASALATYGISNADFKKIYLDVPDVSVAPQDEDAVKGMYSARELDPLETIYVSNVVLNPIYHIRMVVAEWQYKRYESNKAKKKVLELRLLHLQLQNEKQSSAPVQKEIKYLQSRIDGLDRDLSEVKKSLGLQ